MDDILVVVGSITGATRLAKRLTKYGDRKARVIGTPTQLGGGGCSYSVRASRSSEQFIRNNLHGISVKGIYIEKKLGSTGEYYDISR